MNDEYTVLRVLTIKQRHQGVVVVPGTRYHGCKEAQQREHTTLAFSFIQLHVFLRHYTRQTRHQSPLHSTLSIPINLYTA
jgi:hypothetical protein